ncbi:MAG: chromosomal replication initiator protein DnaA [Acidobacteriota bacterium]
MNIWDKILTKLRDKIGLHRFETWFSPTRFISDKDSMLKISVPNELFAQWLKTNYSTTIEEILQEMEESPRKIDFVSTISNAAAQKEREPSRKAFSLTPPSQSALQPMLNPKYTFSNFVVSKCNQFANAAAKAVVEAVAKRVPTQYNPLYIYGGVGLGKTHLMQAIGHEVHRGNPNTKLIYISTENFTNELINAIRFERTQAFRDKYRNVSLLLIDDIQFLAGKERTQEEFFHTFNALYDAKKQIVITSDCAPKEIPTLEERLKSRFEWGLIADIQAPDLETKVAILEKKAEAEKFDIPKDVSMYIASRVKSNIRQLEGALVKLLAFTSFSGRDVTIDLAKEVLESLFQDETPLVTAESIQKYIANYFNIKVSELKSKNNSKQIVYPRQIAMYLCKTLTDLSLPEIGKKFGGKHHSTVIHSIKKIEEKLESDKDFNKLINSFTSSLK